MHPTPESETRRLLQLAIEIATDVTREPSELLIATVFQRLCLETDLRKPSMAAEAAKAAH